MKNHKLGASLLSLDFLSLEEKIRELISDGIDFFHIDIMDGNFVPNLSFSAKFVESIRMISPEIPIDIHFMVTEKAFFNIISQFTVFKPEFVTVHRDVISDLKYVKEMLKKEDIKIGVALNPEIEINSITDAIDYIDLVLLMSVKAGFGGQKFIDNTFKKIKDLSALKENFLTEVDGGIDLPISLKLKDYGVDLIVVGTSLINSKDQSGFINTFKNY